MGVAQALCARVRGARAGTPCTTLSGVVCGLMTAYVDDACAAGTSWIQRFNLGIGSKVTTRCERVQVTTQATAEAAGNRSRR